MDVLLNPVQPQMIPKQEQKRLQLQKERNEEMKRFLAQQASNSHPRLVKLLKKHENPSTSINSFPNFGSAQEKMQPTRLPMMMSPSLQTSARQANQDVSSMSSRQQGQQQYHQQQYPQQQYQQQAIPSQPRDSIYGFPAGVHQYPTMQYHPNPYLPPFNYSPVCFKT